MNNRIEISNRELIAECMNGNQDALSLFYTRFAPGMLRVVRRYVPVEKDAEDILHDGFIIAYTRLSALHDPDHPDYWLATIMKNLSLKFLQNQDIVTILHDLPEVENPPEMEEIIDMATLESLIRKLPSGYQNVFRLAVLENKSHKEISKILGIAPNSSSSQLFHAKIMMRRLIMEHRRKAGLLSLIVVVVAGGLLTMRHHSVSLPDMPDAGKSSGRVVIASNSDEENVESLGIPYGSPIINPSTGAIAQVISSGSGVPREAGTLPPEYIPGSEIAISANDVEPATVEAIEEGAEKTASSLTGKKGEVKAQSENTAYDYSRLRPDPLRKDDKGVWCVGAGVSAGIVSTSGSRGENPEFSSSTSAGIHPPGNGDYEDGYENQQSTRSRSLRETYDYNEVAHHNYQPISFTVAVNRAFSNVVGLETGVSYTYLHTKFENNRSEMHCHWHYLGIPLKMTFNTYSNRSVRLYASFGGEIAFPVATSSSVKGESSPIFNTDHFCAPTEFSLSASYGISFRISDRVGIFVEPSLQYHFKATSNVPNIWTDNRWNFSLPLGFRFNL